MHAIFRYLKKQTDDTISRNILSSFRHDLSVEIDIIQTITTSKQNKLILVLVIFVEFNY